MTTPITQYRISHTLTGSIVPLPYDWKIDAATELLVTLVNTSVTPNVETTLVNGTDYSVSGVGSDSGGNVTTTTAYTAGWKIIITNNVPYNQAVDFTNQNSVRPEVVEQMGDSLSKQIKQIVEALTRCVKITIGSGLSPEDLVDDLYANTAAAAASASNAATSASNAATSETSANNWAIAAQNAATGINWTKARAASTANINISSPGGTIDGVALSALDRVLLKDQTTAAQNGIYIWNGAAVAMTRAADMDTWQEVVSKVVVIEEGALNADIPYISTVNTGGTLGTTAIPFIVFQPPLQDGAVSTTAKLADGIVTQAKVSTGYGLVPSGAIMGFALSAVPSGWLECDGSAVSRTTYAALFSAISTMYGVGDGSTTFNLPDYRGEFLRGYDHGRGADPDAATRTNRGDGTTGNNIGTKQIDAFKAHTHTYNAFSGGALSAAANGSSGSGTNSTSSVGGTETRPRNVYVMYCIKT